MCQYNKCKDDLNFENIGYHNSGVDQVTVLNF